MAATQREPVVVTATLILHESVLEAEVYIRFDSAQGSYDLWSGPVTVPNLAIGECLGRVISTAARVGPIAGRAAALAQFDNPGRRSRT